MKKNLARSISRRDFLRGAAGTLGAAALFSTSSLLRPARSMAFPPDPLFRDVARMVFHENPWGPHPAAVDAVRELMGKALAGGGLNRYDDFLQNDLKEAVLRYNGLEEKASTENVALGMGSTELLFMATDAYLEGGDVPFMTEWPTYYVIIDRAEQNRAEVVKAPLNAVMQADLDGMASRAEEAARQGRPFALIHFNVINNPMGTFLEQESFDAFARRIYQVSPETVILCDDSDPEYMEPDKRPHLFNAAGHVVEGKNMLHVQTFSHGFGLTGLRIGYALARKDIIEKLESRKIYAGLNVTGHAAALASLQHADEQAPRSRRLCTESRNWLYGELDAMGLEYHPSQGHYIMINLDSVDGTLAVLAMYLFKKVFPRWGMDWDLDNYIRVNPGTERENLRFIDALKWVLGRKSFRSVSAREKMSTTEGRQIALAALRSGFPAHLLHRVGMLPYVAGRSPSSSVATV